MTKNTWLIIGLSTVIFFFSSSCLECMSQDAFSLKNGDFFEYKILGTDKEMFYVYVIEEIGNEGYKVIRNLKTDFQKSSATEFILNIDGKVIKILGKDIFRSEKYYY